MAKIECVWVREQRDSQLVCVCIHQLQTLPYDIVSKCFWENQYSTRSQTFSSSFFLNQERTAPTIKFCNSYFIHIKRFFTPLSCNYKSPRHCSLPWGAALALEVAEADPPRGQQRWRHCAPGRSPLLFVPTPEMHPGWCISLSHYLWPLLRFSWTRSVEINPKTSSIFTRWQCA